MKNLGFIFPLALFIVFFITAPTIFIVYNAFTIDAEIWIRLYETRLKFLLVNTLKLILGVGVIVLILGTLCAWIITRYEFWGKGFWQIALLLPITIPGYIMAYAYTSINSPASPFGKLLSDLSGTITVPSLTPFLGAVLVLSFINYPYVYLLARASFLAQTESHEELARIYGLKGFRKLWKVNFSSALPGIMAGLALALMEVLSDFGTVSLLRYPTFTEAIYRQMTGRFDPYGASALSSVLLSLTILLVGIERYFRERGYYHTITGNFRPLVSKKLGFWGSTGLNVVLLFITTLSFFLPVSILLYWTVKCILEGLFDSRLVGFTLNTLIVSGLGALLASILAFPIAYFYTRGQGLVPKLIYHFGTVGYGLPGPVIAVALLFILKTFSPSLIGHFLILPFAYVVRFLPVAVQSQKTSLTSVSKSMEEVGVTLGAGFLKIFRKIIFPLTAPGFLTGTLLVFVDAMKELPATLMLRPLAFDTLAVRVYNDAVESLWESASLPALLIVISGFLPVYFLLKMSSSQKYYAR